MASKSKSVLRKFKIELNDTNKSDGWYDFITPHGNLSRQFHVMFNTTMNYTEGLAFCDLAIYNLSKETSIRSGSQVRLSAGYEDEFDAIFEGRVTSVIQERQGANIITRLLCMGHAAYVRHKVNLSYGANVSVVTILRDIAQEWGLTLSIDESQFDETDRLMRGYTLNGDIPSVMNKLASQFDFEWAQHNQFLSVARPLKPFKGAAREVSFKTGLIGVPEMSSDNTGFAVDLTVRLSPKIRLNNLIELKSTYASYNTGNMYVKQVSNNGKVSGTYRVVTISHEGDSWGDRWQTKIRAHTCKLAKS